MEISELPLTIKCNSVPIDVIVNVGFISMGAKKESVFSFEKARGEVIADLICFLRRYFAGLKGLTNLVNKHVALFILSGKCFVLPF